jgi:predicted ATPase with chaperone activity
MNVKQIQKYYKLSEESKTLLKKAMVKLNLSARFYDKVLKAIKSHCILISKLFYNFTEKSISMV